MDPIHSDDGHARAYGGYGLLFCILVAIASVGFITSIIAAVPKNPLTLHINTLRISQWYPQGWGFFSKNPRDDMLFVYDMSDKSEAPAWPNNVASNLFGLKRLGRSQGIEMGLIQYQIPPSQWEECKDDAIKCLDSEKPQLSVTNDTPNATMCGDLGLVQQAPVPWAWSRHAEDSEMPSKVVRVNVICSKK